MTVLPAGLLFPLLLWVTARCTPVFAAAAAFIVALTVVSTTTFDIGILGDPSLPMAQRILVAQAGILTVSFCALVLAALFAERKANEARLAHSNLMLERERDNKLIEHSGDHRCDGSRAEAAFDGHLSKQRGRTTGFSITQSPIVTRCGQLWTASSRIVTVPARY